MFAVATACLAVMVAGVHGRAPQTTETQAPQFRSEVELVLVDMTVTSGDGTPVASLRPDQVDLRVDGEPRGVKWLRYVRSDAALAPAALAPAPPSPAAAEPGQPTPESRQFVLVVDREGMPAGGGMAMLDAAVRFVEQLPVTDRVAAWVLPTPPARLSLNQPRPEVVAALRGAVGTAAQPTSLVRMTPGEAKAIEIGDTEMLRTVIARECARPVLAGTTCPQIVRFEATTRALDAEHHSEVTSRVLQDLFRALAGVPGPKHVVLITGGVLESARLLKDTAAVAAGARVHVHAFPLPRADWYEDVGRGPELLSELNLTPEVSAVQSLAVMTGGYTFTGIAPRAGFDRLARELSASYLLAFEPAPRDRDGEMHEIRVRLRDVPGASVRARRRFSIPAAPPETTRAAQPADAHEPPAPQAPVAAPEVATPTDAARPGATEALASLLERMGRRVEEFNEAFSRVVVEEDYWQVVRPSTRIPASPDDQLLALVRGLPPPRKSRPVIQSRHMRSDVLMVRPAGGTPTSYRDVFEVDGRTVRDRDDRVRTLFLSPSQGAREQLRRIDFESARYNLGTARRTVNTPTFPLEYLQPRFHSRVAFEDRGLVEVDGRRLRLLEFRETVRPSLVATSSGANIPAQGRVWIEPETGLVARASVLLDQGHEARRLVQVSFTEDPTDHIPVPAMMWEWNGGAAANVTTTVGPDGRPNKAGRNAIGTSEFDLEGIARYANIRRFTVSTSEEIR